MLWVVFLVAGNDTIGIVALAFWWIVVVAGLLILVRWLPSRGKLTRRRGRTAGRKGRGSPVLAHVGMLVGVVVFTWAYLVRGLITPMSQGSVPMRLGTLLTMLALVVGALAADPHAATAPVDRGRRREAGHRHSVRGRPITAWRLGERRKPKVLLVATMHGDEGATADPRDAPRRQADPRAQPVGAAVYNP